jgi:hypothetical protein
MGTTLNQLLREQIERLAGSNQRVREAQAYLATAGQGDSGGWKFDRNELQRTATRHLTFAEFIDTNILVYVEDSANPKKQFIASRLISYYLA